jgi:bifunctional polynucleotide phosphatase/kinase
MFSTQHDKNGLLYYYAAKESHPSSRVLFADLDHTIIIPKSGRKHPINHNDWKFMMDPKIFRPYLAAGWRLVILTNQKKMTLADVESKMPAITGALELSGIHATILVATQDDFYRKPSTGMVDFLLEHLNGSHNKLDKVASFMVGDAAGRKGDHSPADLMLAENAAIHFMTPEIFMSDFRIPPQANKIIANTEMKKLIIDLVSNPKYFNPQAYICSFKEKDIQDRKKGMEALEESISTAKNFILVMVGPPASTKSTLANHLISKVAPSTTIMSYDTFSGTKTAFKKEVAKLLSAKQNVIIDNTNAKAKDRQQWIDLANASETPYIKLEVFYDLPKPLVMHLNDLRNKMINSSRITNTSHEVIPEGQDATHVPDVAIHTWYKYLEPPSSTDGADRIYHFTSIDIEQTKRFPHFLEWNC